MTLAGRVGYILFRIAYICNSIDKSLIQNRTCKEQHNMLNAK